MGAWGTAPGLEQLWGDAPGTRFGAVQNALGMVRTLPGFTGSLRSALATAAKHRARLDRLFRALLVGSRFSAIADSCYTIVPRNPSGNHLPRSRGRAMPWLVTSSTRCVSCVGPSLRTAPWLPITMVRSMA